MYNTIDPQYVAVKGRGASWDVIDNQVHDSEQSARTALTRELIKDYMTSGEPHSGDTDRLQGAAVDAIDNRLTDHVVLNGTGYAVSRVSRCYKIPERPTEDRD